MQKVQEFRARKVMCGSTYLMSVQEHKTAQRRELLEGVTVSDERQGAVGHLKV
jgi:hypothetical protein